MAHESHGSATGGRYATADDFNVVAARVGENLVRLLGVDPRTLKRWRAGRSRIPWAAYQLAYEHSSYALAERDSEHQFQRTMLIGERDALLVKVAQLEAELVRQARLVDWGCANDPFILPTDPRAAMLIDNA